MVQTNKWGANKSKEAWDAFTKGYVNRLKKNTQEVKQEFEAFTTSLTSHRVLNEFEKIDNEYEKILDKFEKGKDWTPEMVKQFKSLFDITKKERIELEQINQVYQNLSKSLDIMGAKASYMMNSYSPITQQKGEILELKKNYNKAGLDIAKELDNVNKKYMQDGKWKANSEKAQKYAALLKQEFVEIQKAFERDLWRKQHPLWTDMMDMSKNWADGLSDSLSDLVLDFENFADSITSLWQSIIRDVTKATISRTITQPLMESFGGSGEPGSPNKVWDWVKGVFGNGAGNAAEGVGKRAEEQLSILDQMLQSNEPIPVYIVEAPPIKSVQDAVDTTTDAMKENKDSVENGFKNNQSILSRIVTALLGGGGSGGGKSSIINGIVGAVASYYGGGVGGGMNTGAPAHVGAGGTTAFGMADGGSISEHIIGRGLKSGRTYEFGERSKYGEFEDVVPRNKMVMSNSGQSVTVSMPINLNALDTRSGVEFILQNQKVLETKMMRNIRNNKAIRNVLRKY